MFVDYGLLGMDVFMIPLQIQISLSAEALEIQYYHSRPYLLRHGDQHNCHRSLSKLLSGPPSTRRQWLRKVKQSSAELTKDGTTRQLLITTFFRPI